MADIHDNSNNEIVWFQDEWKKKVLRLRVGECNNDDHNGYDDDDGTTSLSSRVEELFFDLANARYLGYRLVQNDHSTPTSSGSSTTTNSSLSPSTSPPSSSTTVIVRQDIDSGAALEHTGGIVWETAYLLLNYLLMIDNTGQRRQHHSKDVTKQTENDNVTDLSRIKRQSETATGDSPKKSTKKITTQKKKSKSLLEVGAGCGMLGLVLKKASELHMPLRFFSTTSARDADVEDDDDTRKTIPQEGLFNRVILTETDNVITNLRNNVHRNTVQTTTATAATRPSDNKSTGCDDDVQVHTLDWTRYQQDCIAANIKPHSIDCIVGTDVVFSTRFVKPLLQTLAYVSHPTSVIYLCLQERCKDSYQLLLNKAQSGDFYDDDTNNNNNDDYQNNNNHKKGDNVDSNDDRNIKPKTQRFRYCRFDVRDISNDVYRENPQTCGWGETMECKILQFKVVLLFDNNMNDKTSMKKKEKKKKEKKKEKRKREKRRRSNEDS